MKFIFTVNSSFVVVVFIFEFSHIWVFGPLHLAVKVNEYWIYQILCLVLLETNKWEFFPYTLYISLWNKSHRSSQNQTQSWLKRWYVNELRFVLSMKYTQVYTQETAPKWINLLFYWGEEEEGRSEFCLLDSIKIIQNAVWNSSQN